MGVEVRHVFGQHSLKLAPVEDQHPIQQLAADSADPSLSDAVRPRYPHRGARDADGLAGKHSIEDGGELAVAISDQAPELSRAVAEVHQQVPCLLGDPGSGRVRGDAEQVHAAGGMLDHEQDVEPVQQQRVDAEEVRGENAVCLRAQEFCPAGPLAARCGFDAGSLQDQPHGAGCKPVAKPGKFAVDPSISPG
jgi:hypothetical protein